MRVLEHITAETIERYALRQLPPAELLAVQTHVAQCDGCREGLARALDVDAAFAQIRSGLSAGSLDFDAEPEHLPYEQLAAYVDDSLDIVEREIAESHFAICSGCADDMGDLRRYQAMSDAAVRPAEAAPPIVTASAKGARTFWSRLSSFSFVPSFGMLGPAAAATVVIAAMLGWWVVTRPDSTSGSKEIARDNPSRSESIAAPQPSAPVASPTMEKQTPVEVQPSANQSTMPTTKKPQPSGTGSAPTTPTLRFTLNDGGEQIAFDNHGNLRGFENLPPSVRQTVRRSLEAQRVERPRTLENLSSGATGVLMSGAGANGASSGVPFALIEPVGKVVRGDRPTLRWRTLEGAKHYTVAVVSSNFRVVAQSPTLPTTEWTPPDSLQRGATYSWQVTATLADGSEVTSPASPAPQAKFRVLEESAFDDLKLLEKASPDSHLARGVLYAKAGLLAEAESEFEKLVRLNPRSPVARKLLQSARRR